MPGPRPTPTATLANRGSWRAQTRANEPKPTASTQDAPAELTGRARELWDSVAVRLIHAGVLTSADRAAFARYCRLYATWESAMQEVEAKADRSSVLTLAKLDEMLRKLEANFGLTPADRTGIQVEQPEKEGKARFFGAS